MSSPIPGERLWPSASLPGRTPRAKEICILVLAAESAPSGPGWVLDVFKPSPGRLMDLDNPGTYRPVMFARIYAGEPLRLDCGCGPRGLCPRHGPEQALRWWEEAHRRDREKP